MADQPQLPDLYIAARIARAVEAVEDGDQGLAVAILVDLENDVAEYQRRQAL